MIKNLKDVWSLDVRSLDIATSSKQVISWGQVGRIKKEISTLAPYEGTGQNTIPLRLEKQICKYKESQVTRIETSLEPVLAAQCAKV